MKQENPLAVIENQGEPEDVPQLIYAPDHIYYSEEYDESAWCENKDNYEYEDSIFFEWKEGKGFVNTKLAKKAIVINDNEKTTLKEKEAALQELFKEYGHEIEFIGEY